LRARCNSADSDRGPMSNALSPATFRFPKTASLGDVEGTIRDIDTLKADGDVRAFVASSYSRDVLADIWSALAVGTLLRKGHRRTAVAWGSNRPELFAPRRFALTPPGLVTTALADEVVLEGTTQPEDMKAVREWIRGPLKGYLGNEPNSRGADRWIVEFDDARALSLRGISDCDDHIDRRAFDQLISQVRKELEIWWPREQKAQFLSASEHSVAKARLTDFIKELFENAYQHGRRTGGSGSYTPNLRFMRFRKITGSRDALTRRAGDDIAIVKEFVAASLSKKSEPAFLEISISDFGYGIVDKFLSSPAGKKHHARPRTEVFDELLYNNLTSNSLDPAAGLGIFNALHAARKLGAFVSVRTNEFWRAQNFASRTADIQLKDIAKQRLGGVAGTHWQFIWAPPPL
jgi:hypothetical protein